MALNNDRYTYRVTWSVEDEEYRGLCAEFASLSWLAGSPEAALGGIRQVVAAVVADLEAEGEPIPEPLPLGDRDRISELAGRLDPPRDGFLGLLESGFLGGTMRQAAGQFRYLRHKGGVLVAPVKHPSVFVHLASSSSGGGRRTRRTWRT